MPLSKQTKERKRRIRRRLRSFFTNFPTWFRSKKARINKIARNLDKLVETIELFTPEGTKIDTILDGVDMILDGIQDATKPTPLTVLKKEAEEIKDKIILTNNHEDQAILNNELEKVDKKILNATQ